MKRWVLITAGLLVIIALVLAGCGGSDDNGDDTGNANGAAIDDPQGVGDDGEVHTPPPTLAPAITATFPPPAPRSKELPTGEPVDFEAPFSAGNFVRVSHTGNPMAGGQRAIYVNGDDTVVLNIYYFAQVEEAARTVDFTLKGAGVAQLLGDDPYYAPAVSYGMAQNTNGSHVAAWSHQGWAFVAQTDEVAVLQAFLDVFPY